MTIGEEARKAAEPIIATADDIIREAVKVYPDLPHDKAVLQWLSKNYPEYAKIYQKVNAKYAGRVGIGDVALHYAVTEMIEKAFKLGEKGFLHLTRREAILVWFIMAFSYAGSMFLIWKIGYYGLIVHVAVAAAIIAFFLALERGLIRKR